MRHRGPGEVALLENGPRQLLEVEVNGVYLQDFGREEVLAVAERRRPSWTTAGEGPLDTGRGNPDCGDPPRTDPAPDLPLDASLGKVTGGVVEAVQLENGSATGLLVLAPGA